MARGINAKVKSGTPVYCLDTFSTKAGQLAFYIETLQVHLQKHEMVSRPHRHDFYLVLYITKGGGEHTIDFVTYPVKPGSFFVMTPGQVHSWKLKPGTDGFIFFFVPEFYQLGKDEKHLLEFPFFRSVNPHPYIQLKAGQDAMIDFTIREMLREYNSSGEPFLSLIRSYLDVVLLKLARHYQAEVRTEASHATTIRLRKLEELIDQNFIKLKQPNEYAALMNLSSSYLNSLCKQLLGKTLGDLIQERVMLEAKRYFAHSDLTVSQVSDKLNFSEASYFIRFFRKHAGVTPEQFREQIHK
ncbi:MAG TPA: AraC family transcriptional regulator [Ohtaekwangia sp.]|uniref:helix-turn-helix domain-containing protein n=1 Tax=Ohtaekwangia sp. TaxID=2066019 RepID=UPI002F952BF1